MLGRTKERRGVYEEGKEEGGTSEGLREAEKTNKINEENNSHGRRKRGFGKKNQGKKGGLR